MIADTLLKLAPPEAITESLTTNEVAPLFKLLIVNAAPDKEPAKLELAKSLEIVTVVLLIFIV